MRCRIRCRLVTRDHGLRCAARPILQSGPSFHRVRSTRGVARGAARSARRAIGPRRVGRIVGGRLADEPLDLIQSPADLVDPRIELLVAAPMITLEQGLATPHNVQQLRGGAGFFRPLLLEVVIQAHALLEVESACHRRVERLREPNRHLLHPSARLVRPVGLTLLLAVRVVWPPPAALSPRLVAEGQRGEEQRQEVEGRRRLAPILVLKD